MRAERIRIVRDVLGREVVERMLQDVRRAQSEAAAAMTRARAAGRDVSRLERMLDTTRDLHGRAVQAFARGDATAALDLGSHAATLVNAIRISLTAS